MFTQTYRRRLTIVGISDAVPNAETAAKIADIALEIQFPEESTEGFHMTEIIFLEDSNLWQIYYDPGLVVGGAYVVFVRKDCGMIQRMASFP